MVAGADEIEGNVVSNTEASEFEIVVDEDYVEFPESSEFSEDSLLGAKNKYTRENVTFKDTRGNEVVIEGGADSCATRIVEFNPGNPFTKYESNSNKDSILGAPDYEATSNGNNGGALSIGRAGSIVLEFSVSIVDGEGNDIYVFEVGPQVEATKVEVSDDLKNWIYVGDAKGSISGVDMNGKVPEGAMYHYVRITDLKTSSDKSYPGADIDAVAIIHSKATPFKDNPADKYYFTPIIWAYDLGITTGTKEDAYDPYVDCTRAQAITFIWRVKNEPAATISSTTFEDIKTDSYYYKALLWGVENGVIKGFDDKTFGPNEPLTRCQFVSMLHRLEGSKESSIENPFEDVKENKYYYKSVLWALEKNVTSGKDATHFAPDDNCQRGQIVTFLYRTYASK